jgi:YfiH family protein
MKIVRSTLLSAFPEVMFGMSTNTGGVSADTLGLNLSFNVGDSPENVLINRNTFFSALGIPADRVAFTQQEHTVNIISVKVPGINEHCDALITDQKDVYLAISIADCTPVVLYDPVHRIVAGIHAGWRGTAGGIVTKTIGTMASEHGTDPHDLIAFIGPSAGKCCYEVGREVAEQFDERSLTPASEGKFMLDVKHANMLQILDSGVSNSNIEMHSDCSIHDPLYHSHRRDGKRSGRMFAVIGIFK